MHKSPYTQQVLLAILYVSHSLVHLRSVSCSINGYDDNDDVSDDDV